MELRQLYVIVPLLILVLLVLIFRGKIRQYFDRRQRYRDVDAIARRAAARLPIPANTPPNPPDPPNNSMGKIRGWWRKKQDQFREWREKSGAAVKAPETRFLRTVLLVTLVLVAISLLLVYLGDDSTIPGTTALRWNWGWFMFFMIVGWFSASLEELGPDEKGVLLFFGRPVAQHGPGLVFVPALLTKLVRLLGSDYSQELPAEASRIDKVNQDNPAEGKVPPIRIVHPDLKLAFFYQEKPGDEPGQGDFTKPYSALLPEEKELLSGDPLNARLTTEVNALLLYCIENSMQYVTRVSKEGGEKGREVVRERTADVTTAALQSIMGRITASEALSHKDVVSRKVLARIESLVGEPRLNGEINSDWWGINVKRLEVMLVDPGKNVNTQIAKAVASEFTRRETVANAQAARSAAILEGEGKSQAILLQLTAEAEGAAKLAEIAGTSGGQFVLQQQAAIEIGKSSRHTLVQTDMGILGAFAGVAKVVTEAVKTPPTEPTP